MYEKPAQNGVGHFLESTAFKSTASRTSHELHSLSTHNGITLSAANSREIIAYRADCVRGSVPLTVELLADTLRNPLISDAEVQYARVRIGEYDSFVIRYCAVCPRIDDHQLL